MPEVITENLDLWTSALLAKSAAGRGSNGKQEAYGIKKLRELILELAVRGKLVPQDPNDEPASELLRRIQTEKKKLIAEGKIKKDKPLPPIADEVKPFVLANGWEWCYLKEICVLENGDRSKNYPNKSVLVEFGVPFVNAGHLQNGRINEDEMTFITEERFELLNAGKFVDGDILFCLRGSLGKSAIVEKFGKGAIASSLVIVRLLGDLDRYYFHNYFDSPLSYQYIKKYDNGTAQPNLSAADLGRFLIPVPPDAEQHRIVAKLDELMALCDRLEQQQADSIEAHQTLVETLLGTLTRVESQQEFSAAWARIASHFDTLFTTEASIDQLKQTILQLAVMGKLVPQDPDDEPANVLLESIAKEKERLIKVGLIKKQKPIAGIEDGDVPFMLPEGWEWERLGNLATQITDGVHHTPNYIESGVPFISVKDIDGHTISFADCKYISQAQHEEINVRCNPEYGDLLICRIGTLGRATIVDTKEPFSLFVSVGLLKFIQNLFTPRYAHLVLHSPLLLNQYQEIKAEGSHTNKLNLGDLPSLIIPVAPLSEQHRIVAKVDELMALCDALKARLADAQALQLHLADAIVEQAVA